MANKKTVTTTDKDGNELLLDVSMPSAYQLQKAQSTYASAWMRAAKDDDVSLNIELEDLLKKKGIWGDKQEEEAEDLKKQFMQKTIVLRGGNMKKSEARALALEILQLKIKWQELMVRKAGPQENTAEALGNMAKINYLVSVCVVYNTDGKPYFKDVDNYVNRMNEKASRDVRNGLLELLNEQNEPDDDDESYEMKVLKRLGFMDDEGHLLNERGQITTLDGKAINKNGQFINENNELVDSYGNLVDEKGEYLIEEKPFLEDDNGAAED